MNYISNFGNSFYRLFHGSSKNYEIKYPNESGLIQRQMARKFGGELLSDYDILLPTDTVYKKIYKLAAKKILNCIIFGVSMFSVTSKFIFQSCNDITNLNIDDSKKENVSNEIRKKIVEVESDAKSENHSFENVQNISNDSPSTEAENELKVDSTEPCKPTVDVNSNISENIHSNNSNNDEIDATESCKNILNESKNENVPNEIQNNPVENESEEKSDDDGFEIIDYPPIAEFCNVYECNVKEKHLHLKCLKNSDGVLFKNEEDKEIDTENNIIVLEGKLKIAGDSRAALYIIPNVHFYFYLKIETLVICDQVLTLNQLKYLLTDSIKNLEFHGNSIFDNDVLKTLVPVEVLLKSCPNIEKFKMDCFGYKFTVENLKNIAEILSDDSKNLRKFYLYKLSSSFSLSSSMYGFIVNNFRVDLCFYYEDTVKSFTDSEIKNFDLLFKRISESLEMNIPDITIPGYDSEDYQKCQKELCK
uniref:Uncharacterized protein n=1 Tax=Panagrolaimus davidi TaxID=227884 RepID=A0A914PJD2_9BILA